MVLISQQFPFARSVGVMLALQTKAQAFYLLLYQRQIKYVTAHIMEHVIYTVHPILLIQ
jgi:hypothetical protein